MKKPKLRSIIWIALTVISLASYGYLNSTPAASQAYGMNQNMEEELSEEQESRIFLPDIALVKKLLNITKIVMPSD